MRLPWDINYFNKINLPTVVEAVDLPFGKIRVLDLPVKMAGDSCFRIPNDIKGFEHVINASVDYEVKNFGNIEDYYVYITIDQKTVNGGNTGRRPGAHSDAYIEQNGIQVDVKKDTASLINEISHTYIAYDTSPTEFFNAKFPISGKCDEVMSDFDAIAETAEVITYPCFTLLMMTPYAVHRSAVVDETTFRTFVKVSISKRKYTREGNTKNELFDYCWKSKERKKNTRNHPW